MSLYSKKKVWQGMILHTEEWLFWIASHSSNLSDVSSKNIGLGHDNKNVAIETTVRDATEEFNDYCEGDSKNMIILLFFSRMKSEQSQPSLTCLSSLSIMVATHTFLWEDVIVVILWLLLRLRGRVPKVGEGGGGKKGNWVPMYIWSLFSFHKVKWI